VNAACGGKIGTLGTNGAMGSGDAANDCLSTVFSRMAPVAASGRGVLRLARKSRDRTGNQERSGTSRHCAQRRFVLHPFA
jgi:hypothetical protein